MHVVAYVRSTVGPFSARNVCSPTQKLCLGWLALYTPYRARTRRSGKNKVDNVEYRASFS